MRPSSSPGDISLLLFFLQCVVLFCVGVLPGAMAAAAKSAWSPGRRRRWCEDSATSDEDLLSDAGIDVEDDEVSNGRPVFVSRCSNSLLSFSENFLCTFKI